MNTFIIASIVTFIIWLFVLIKHLSSDDLDSTDKICWTVVLCTLNILGVVLYFICPIKSREIKPLISERDIKKAANNGTLRSVSYTHLTLPTILLV